MLAGGTIGGLSGYMLAPEGRKGRGAMYGAGLGSLGAGAGSSIAPYLHNTAKPSLGARAGVNAASTGLGTLAGIGGTAALADKSDVPTSEDPYHYVPR